jgi:hypothetical protein
MKGGKTRTLLMPESVWNALMSLRKDRGALHLVQATCPLQSTWNVTLTLGP